jgi:hypothetical protein
MSDSQKWCIWAVVLVGVGLVAAFVGGPYALAVFVYVVARLAGQIGGLCLVAVAVTALRKRI